MIKKIFTIILALSSLVLLTACNLAIPRLQNVKSNLDDQVQQSQTQLLQIRQKARRTYNEARSRYDKAQKNANITAQNLTKIKNEVSNAFTALSKARKALNASIKSAQATGNALSQPSAPTPNASSAPAYIKK